MRSFITIIAILFIFLGACGNSEIGLEKKVHEFTLANGMKWFLVRRGYAPVFAGIIQVKVGGADEVKGKTGLAHLLEHMAFKGTSSIGTRDFAAEKEIMDKVDELIEQGKPEEISPLIDEQKKYVVPNEIWDIFTRNGAHNLNAYTTKDVTTYHAEMPNSKLELWIYLISEMISDPAFREFYTEKNVVLEELRTSIDNNPRGRLYKSLLESAYKRSPYSWPTLGLTEDVSRLTRKDLKDFYKSHYLPECMAGAIVGDIDIGQTEELLRKYFGPLKGKGKICHRTIAIDPPQDKEESGEVEFDAEPILAMAFHKPTAPNFDDYIFDVFVNVLCEGESSRMQRQLVKEERIAKRVACFTYPGTRLPNLFVIYAEPFDAASLGPLESEILKELHRLASDPIKPAEFKKVKNQMKTSFLMEIDSNFELAHMLVYFENMTGSWRYILSHPRNIDQITVEDMIRAAKRYFVPGNMDVIKLRRNGE